MGVVLVKLRLHGVSLGPESLGKRRRLGMMHGSVATAVEQDGGEMSSIGNYVPRGIWTQFSLVAPVEIRHHGRIRASYPVSQLVWYL